MKLTAFELVYYVIGKKIKCILVWGFFCILYPCLSCFCC